MFFTHSKHVLRLLLFGLLVTPVLAADGDLKPQSHWRNAQHDRCLTVGDLSKPLAGSDECASFSGSLGKTGPVSGYACAKQKTIGFFTSIAESDNAIKPDFFVGSYTDQSIDVQYCTRISNDWPPEFNCQNAMKFLPVATCNP